MRQLFLASVALLMTAPLASAETVSGTVTYLQRMMLPPDAVVEVVLQDVSRADAPAETLGTYTIEAPGAPPFHFSVEIADDLVDTRNSYGLRATVRRGETLLMTTDTAYPVLTRGAGNEAELILKQVASPAATDRPDADFVNSYWKLLTLGGDPVPVANDQKEPHVILRTDGTYNATVGCNMIRGGFELDGPQVEFQPGAMTMMACVPPYDTFERSLVETLENAARFGVTGDTMELLDPAGVTLATFEAVYF